MCTVTFLPYGNDQFIVTSNRDESPKRDTLAPKKYVFGASTIVFPKDVEAGGTWIGISDRNRLICLLNGGFEAHIPKKGYRMSRGVLVNEFLTAKDIYSAISSFNYIGIEPFTIILVDWNVQTKLHELVWDGEQAHFTERPWAPQIWSSSLLYSSNVKKERETWFSSFLMQTNQPSSSEILDFHKTAGIGDPASNLILNRGFVKTKSITQIQRKETAITMRYQDLEKNHITEVSL